MIGLLVAGRLDRFGAPHHRADILLALGIGRILVIEHHALRHRRDGCSRRRRLADAIGNLRLATAASNCPSAASTAGCDLNSPLTLETTDLPHRIAAPTRISTMPMAIALLNGNTAPERARLARLAVAIARRCAARGTGGGGGVALGLLDRLVVGIGRARDRRRGFPGSARAGRTPARATARWRRSCARRGWPGRRRGRDRRHRRRCRGNRARPAPAELPLSAPRRGGPRAIADRRQLRLLHRDLRLAGAGCGRGGGGGGASARGLRARASWHVPGRSSARAAGGRCARRAAAAGGADGRWRRRGRPRRPSLACGLRAGRGIGAAEGIAAARATAPAPPPDAGVAGALGGLGFDLAHGLFQRQPLAGDFGFRQRRLHAAQLRDQRGARPLIERATALAGSTGIQSGDGAGDQRVVIGHINSTVLRFPVTSR